MSDNVSPNDYININERFRATTKLVPKVDELISRLIGVKVFVHDPRLIRLIVKWKKGKLENSMEPDNFLENPEFIKELKETFI